MLRAGVTAVLRAGVTLVVTRGAILGEWVAAALVPTALLIPHAAVLALRYGYSGRKLRATE